MANRFVLNETSYHGKGAIESIATRQRAEALKRLLFVRTPIFLNSELPKRLRMFLIKPDLTMRYTPTSRLIPQ